MTDDRVSVVGSPVSMSCGNVTEEVRSFKMYSATPRSMLQGGQA